MRITNIQMDMALAKPNENFKKAENLIREASKENPDVIVLPETFNTGFFPHENLKDYCDDNGKKTKDVIGSLAKELSVNIVAGSVANLKNGKVYNTSYVFNRKGECIAEYDKTHLFAPMDEDKYFQMGEKLVKFELDLVPCAVIICYDVRFPELTRSLTLSGVDVLFVVSQWPNIRIPHLLALTKARAIENQMFLSCCNSCGVAGQTVYGGNSVMYDPWGETLVKAKDGECIITSDFNLSVLADIRKSINVFNDRRADIYKIN